MPADCSRGRSQAPGPEEVNWPTLWEGFGAKQLRRLLVLIPITGMIIFPIGIFAGAPNPPPPRGTLRTPYSDQRDGGALEPQSADDSAVRLLAMRRIFWNRALLTSLLAVTFVPVRTACPVREALGLVWFTALAQGSLCRVVRLE